MAASQYEELDKYFTALQAAYESGKIDDKTLFYAYGPLEDLDDAKYQVIFTDWIAKQPKSYPARFLYSYYLVNVAWKARGTKFASKTSETQFSSFATLLDRAMTENEKLLAAKLTAKPIISLMNKLRILRAGSSLGMSRAEILSAAQATLAQANAMDPGNMLARTNYMTILSPRWGGTYQEMQAYAKAARAEKISPQLADYLDSRIPEEIGDRFYAQENYEKALPYYYQAASKQAPYYDYGRVEALKSYIYTTYRLSWQKNKSDPNTKEFLAMLDLLLRDGRRIPVVGWYYGERAQVGWNVNKDAKATRADFEKGAAAGDAHSLYNIARNYCYGQEGLDIPTDEKLCASYMAQAAMAGSKHAEEELAKMKPVTGAKGGGWMQR